MGTCRSIVIDAILKTLAKLLAPVSPSYRTANISMDNQNNCIWSNTDLQLLSWLLLFLSVCADEGTGKRNQGNFLFFNLLFHDMVSCYLIIFWAKFKLFITPNIAKFFFLFYFE